MSPSVSIIQRQRTFLYTQKTTALDLAARQEEEEDEEVIQYPIYIPIHSELIM